MKKKFLSIKLNKAQYAIRRVTKGNTEQYIPVVKLPGWFSDWVPIVRLYPEQYVLLPYEVEGLTMSDCKQHIDKFKEQTKLQEEESFFLIQYINV